MPWYSTASGAQVWVDPADGKARVKTPDGAIARISLDELQASLDSDETSLASYEELHAHALAKAEELKPTTTKILEGAEAALTSGAAGLQDFATLPIRAPVAAATALGSIGIEGPGIPDPLEFLSGRHTQENVAAIASELFGGEGEVAAREYAERERRVAAEHPWAAGGARVAAEVAGAVATGGVGALGKAALARVAAGTAEGAGLGVLQSEESAYIADTEATAEARLMGTALGAGFGAAGTAATLAGGKLIGKVFGPKPVKAPATIAAPDAEVLEDGARKALGVEPAPGFGKKFGEYIQEKYAAASSVVSGKSKETIEKFGPLNWSDEAIEGRRLHADREEITQAASRQMVEDLDNLNTSVQEATAIVRSPALKLPAVARNLVDVDEATVLTAASAKAKEVRTGMEALWKEGLVEKKWAQNFLKSANAVEKRVKSGSAPEAVMALDALRRNLHDVQVATRARALAKGAGKSLGDTMQREAVATRMTAMYRDLADHLMDEGVYGKQGAAQKVNHEWVDIINAQRFGMQQLLRQTETTIDGLPVYAANPAGVFPFMRAVGRAENDLNEKLLGEFVDSSARLATGIRKGYDLTPAKSAAVDRVLAAANRMQTTLGKIRKTVAVANQIEAMAELGAGGGIESALGFVGGGLLGGPVGAVAGGALGLLRNPFKATQQATAAAALLRKTNELVGKKVARAIDSNVSRRTAGYGVRFAPTPSTERRAAARTMTAALTAFQGGHASPQAAYDARTREVGELAINDSLRNEQLSRALAKTDASEAPKLHGVTLTKGAIRAQYLASKIPVGKTGNALTPHLARSNPDAADIADFALRWYTSQHPLTALDDLEDGTLTRGQVETIQAVYPSLYRQIVRDTLAHLAKAKTPPPYETRLQLDLLLGLNGAGEPSVAPAFLQRMAARASMQREQKQAARPPPAATASKVAQNYQTQSQSMEEQVA